MNIDLAALRALEREREIPFDTILAAIETALLTAYRHTDGAEGHARVEIDRKNGAALVFAQELDAAFVHVDVVLSGQLGDSPTLGVQTNAIPRSGGSGPRSSPHLGTPGRCRGPGFVVSKMIGAPVLHR